MLLKEKLLLRYPSKLCDLILKHFFDLKADEQEHKVGQECLKDELIMQDPKSNTIHFEYLIKKINNKVIEKNREG